MHLRNIGLFVLLTLLVACGQTGALYLPQTPTKQHTWHPVKAHAKNSFYVGTGITSTRNH